MCRKVHKYTLVLFIYILTFPHNASARYHIQHSDIPLSNNAVLYTYQDKDGYMWFGTYDGLNLYNGKEVITYRHEQGNSLSLCSNIIYKITSAGNDYLWISTTLGLNKFSLKERKIVESYPQLPKVTHIETDQEGNSWIYAKDDTITYCAYNPEKKKFSIFKNIQLENTNLGILNINRLFLHNNNIYLFTNDGRLIINDATVLKSKNKISAHELKVHNTKICKIAIKEDRLYFIDIENNIYKFNLITHKKDFIINLTPYIKEDFGFVPQIEIFKDQIYVACKNQGILKIDDTENLKVVSINQGTPVFCMYPDRFQNLLWIGTDGQGIQQYCETPQLFTQITLENLKNINKPIRSIFTDSLNNLWIGTNGDGLLRIKNYQKTDNNINLSEIDHITKKDGLACNQIFSFKKSIYKKDILWIGSERGLSYYSYKDKRFRIVNNQTDTRIEQIHTIKETSDSTIWLASTCSGLIKATIQIKNGQYYIVSSKSYLLETANFVCSEIHSMSYDGKQHFLIGSRGGYGVAKFNIITGQYNFIPILKQSEKSAIGDVLCVYQGHDSTFYIGSSSGMTKLQLAHNQNIVSTQYDRKEGLINDMIHGILEDNEGYIWLSSNRGLIKYNPKNESFHNYIAPTLNIIEFSDDAFWKCPYTNRLFFGGVNGLVAINPRKIKSDNNLKDNTQFKFFGLKISGTDYPLNRFLNTKNGAIEIPPSISTFSVSFIALDYIHHNNYEYSYKLENYNDDWIDLQKVDEINFINLPYGDYILKVKYKNDVIEGSERIESLHIIKIAPWYLTKTAYIIYSILLLTMCASIVYILRKQMIKKHNRVIDEIEKLQRRELLESKLNFFTNITHEFYTPLTLIKGICETLMKGTQTISEDKYKEHLSTLYNNTYDLEILIQEILKFRDIESINPTLHIQSEVSITNIVNRFLQAYQIIAQQAEINLICFISPNIYWNTDISCFHKILSNLVSNAFKYTPPKGTIRISLYIEENSLILEVYNTGKGIEHAKLSTIFKPYNILEDVDSNSYSQLTTRTGLGLSICHNMVILLKGNIAVDSIIGKSTTFTVVLPNLNKSLFLRENKVDKIEKNSQSETEHLQTVLVIDDNKEIVSMITDYTSDSYKIMKAYNASEALSILQEKNISLIITDIMMPEKDGIQLIKEIKSNKFIKHIPLIVISAKVTDKQQEEGILAGADVYLPKPFSLSLLKSYVDKLLNKQADLKNYYYSPESAYEFGEGSLIHQDEKDFINNINSIIDRNIDNILLSPDFIANELHMNTRTLYRKVKSITTLSPMDFIKSYRFLMSERLLVSTSLTVQEIMYKIGITNKSYFYREFLKRNNTTPNEYRKGKESKKL